MLALVLVVSGVVTPPSRAWTGVAERHRLQIDEPVIFSVVGDVPYDSVEAEILQQNFDDHDLYSPAEFLVHVGDIKLGVAPCDEYHYANMAAMLRSLSVPAFIVPGDNEWTDCLDRVVAWQYWTKHLMGIEGSFCGVPQVEKQAVRPENFAFVLNGVLFIGINLVGGPADRGVMTDDADWVQQQLSEKAAVVRAAVIFAQAGPGWNHNTFFDRFVPDATAFGKPVLYAQGDGHAWKEDQPFGASNIYRIQVERGLTPPVQVTVASDATFHYNRDPWPAGTVAIDRPPCADAGPDLIVPEQGVATLRGKASDDGEPLPTQFRVRWSVLDGPAGVQFADSTVASTTATFEDNGTYVLRLTATDGPSSASDETEVTVGGTGPNDAPVARRDSYDVDVDHTLWVETPGVLGNDSDANGDAMIASVVTPPMHGELMLEPDGSFSYAPAADYAGLDRFVYRASDTVADAEAEVWIGVGGAVHTFVVAADAKVRSTQALTNYGNTTDLRVDEDNPAYHSYIKLNITGTGPVRDAFLRLYVQSGSSDGGRIHAVSNDYEGTTTPWTESGITWSNAPAIADPAIASAGPVLTGQWIDLPLGRAIRGPGVWSFGLRNGITDGVIYGSRESSRPPELILAALPPGANTPPVAVADAYMVNEDESLTVALPGVLANDTDEDLDTLTVSMSSPPTHGTAFLASDGSFSYAPHRDYAGADAFAYVVDDGWGVSDAGIVTLTVLPVNDPPAVKSDAYSVCRGETLAVAAPGVLANDVDLDGDSLAVTLVSGPAHGSVVIAPDGGFVYRPGPGATAPEIFVYEASDGQAAAQATVVLRSPRSQIEAHMFAASESGGPRKAQLAAACAREAGTMAPTTAVLRFEIAGLDSKVERAMVRLYDCDARAWFEHDVTSEVTGNGVLRLQTAALADEKGDFDRGDGGHPPQLIVLTDAEPEGRGMDSGTEIVRTTISRTQLQFVVPNPFTSAVRVEYDLAQSEDVDLVIYNARGQRVRALASGRQAAGRKLLTWDGTDARGIHVPAGIYFLHARLGTQVEKRKLVIAR